VEVASTGQKGPKEAVGYAGVIVYSFPGLEEIERRSARRRLIFPYVPGLLVFREGPFCSTLSRNFAPSQTCYCSMLMATLTLAASALLVTFPRCWINRALEWPNPASLATTKSRVTRSARGARW